MTTHLIVLGSRDQRERAKRYIDQAPPGVLMKLSSTSRTLAQNDKLWALLSEVSRAKPKGLRYTPDQWKCLFMHALGFEILYMEGLSGEPFPAGFRSSRLSKSQMSDLIEFIYSWGAENNVEFNEYTHEK
jgi:hypothetical protein